MLCPGISAPLPQSEPPPCSMCPGDPQVGPKSLSCFCRLPRALEPPQPSPLALALAMPPASSRGPAWLLEPLELLICQLLAQWALWMPPVHVCMPLPHGTVSLTSGHKAGHWEPWPSFPMPPIPQKPISGCSEPLHSPCTLKFTAPLSASCYHTTKLSTPIPASPAAWPGLSAIPILQSPSCPARFKGSWGLS